MRSARTRIRLQVLILLAVAALVSACFGGGSSDDGAEPTGAQQEDAGPPQAGGTYRFTLGGDAPTLDTQTQAAAGTQWAVGLVYSKLVEFKTGPDTPYASTELKGDLAEDWSVSEDGKTWTFNLRQGVQFQDVAPVNGRELTSADVVCTMNRTRELPGVGLNLINMVDTITAPDEYTVVFTLAEPFATFDVNMASHYMWILPCEGTEGQFDLETTAIGTGPFILDSWKRDQERVYVKHPNYYQEGKPYLDSVQVSILSDPAATMAAFRTGELDSVGVSAEDQLQTLLNTNPDTVVTTESTFSPQLLFMNQSVEPFDDLRVRRAVALAIDRESMLKATRPGDRGGRLSGPVMPDALNGMDPEEAAELTPYDPDQAKDLLAEAGYPDGFDISLLTTTGWGPTITNEAQWIQEDLAKVGITVEVDIRDYATFYSAWAEEDYEIGYGYLTAMLTADEYLSSLWPTEGTRNWFGLADPELDAMIKDQRAILDDDERDEAIHDIQTYIIDEVSNPLVLTVADTIGAYQPWVHDMYPHPEYGYHHMADVWVDEESPTRD